MCNARKFFIGVILRLKINPVGFCFKLKLHRGLINRLIKYFLNFDGIFKINITFLIRIKLRF